ncbi:hypothetical protein QR680_017081 [Steinernema hermaphroditum]|uniref:Uncharacterized protein n=1 Tax=Steinernema hermaphroditum TaxID=289476 RepID=A0AA39LND1_9BILA|nr:hypothetical protein QR680_017081 [Steinernema hermaphroditum]
MSTTTTPGDTPSMETPRHSSLAPPMATSPPPTLEELAFRTIVVGSDDTKGFQRALQSRAGWTSDSEPEFPIDVVVGLERPANIYKVVVEVIDENAPSEIDVSVGSHPGSETAEVNYEGASGADYKKKGKIRFTQKSKKEPLEDSQALFVDCHGQFLWLALDGPNHPKAKGDQVSLHRLKIFGYKGSHEKPRERRSPKESEPPKKKETKRRDEEAMRFSSEGDGLSMPADQLGEDPLTSLRIVKKVLGDKRQKALNEDKAVEASMCLRAIDRMEEYEKRIEKLKSKMSDALFKGDTVMAEKHRLAAADCRDTVFRATHVDLLLDRSELRSIGVESKWADEEQDD